MPRRRASKVNAKGRNRLTDRFVRLPHNLLKSAAYRSLGVAARALLIELTMLDDGKNNGSLYLSLRDAADRLGFSDHHSVSAAFDELVRTGFVRCSKKAHFHIKAATESRARCWRLTWLAAPNLKRSATNEWQNYDPPAGSKQRKRAQRGQRALKRYYQALTSHRLPMVESTTLVPNNSYSHPRPVVDSTTVSGEKEAIPPILVEGVSTAHTAATTIIMMRPRGDWWRNRSYFRLPDAGPGILVNDN